MKLISNRKLYRLGVGVAFCMSGFLLYLIYNDVHNTEIGDVTLRHHLIAYTNPSEAYARKEPVKGILINNGLSTLKTITSKNVFDYQDDLNLIPTDFDLKKTTKATTPTDYNFENRNDLHSYVPPRIHSKSNSTQRPKMFVSKQSKQKVLHSNTVRLNPSDAYIRNNNKNIQQSVKHINNNIPHQNKSENYKYINKNFTPSLKRKYTTSKDKAKSNLNHRLLPLDLDNKHNRSRLTQKSDPRNNSRETIRTVAKTKYLVYLCDSLSWCGGWGDRQRGITSNHHLSKLLGREFKIVMDTPCSLTNFYHPRKVNWILRQNEIDPSASKIVLNSISKMHFKDQLMIGDFNLKYPHDVIFLKNNQDLIKSAVKNPFYSKRVESDKAMLSRKSRFRSSWADLMQPSEDILIQLQELVGSKRLINKGLVSKQLVNDHKSHKTIYNNASSLLLNSSSSPHFPLSLSMPSSSSSSSSSSPLRPLICAHVRMGKNPTIPMDEQFHSIEPRDIPKLLHFLQSKDTTKNAEFFLATDYEGIREEFIRFFGKRLIHYGGKIVHIDRQRDTADACLGFGVAVLDQLVLSVCDVLVTSRSGFSIHASYLSNSSHPAYIMEDRQIKVLKI